METAIGDNFQEVRGHIEQFRQILKGAPSLNEKNEAIIPRYTQPNQEPPQSRTTTEITLSTSSEVTQFDDSELNSKVISFPQSPIESRSSSTSIPNFPIRNEKSPDKNKNSFSSSFDTDLTSASPNFNNYKNKLSTVKNDDSESASGSDSDSDPELSAYIAQHAVKVNNLLSKVGFSSSSKKFSQTLSNSDESDDSSDDSDSIDTPPELLESIISNVKAIPIKNVEMAQTIQDTIANMNSRNSKRQLQIEKAMKLLLSASNDEMSDSDSNSDYSNDETKASKAPSVSLQISQPVVLNQEANEFDNDDEFDASSSNQKSLFHLEEVSSDSDDVPLFVPPVPDEIEMDNNFNFVFKDKEKKVGFDPGITSPEALDAGEHLKLKKRKKDKNAKKEAHSESTDSMSDTVDDESTLSFNKIFEAVTRSNKV